MSKFIIEVPVDAQYIMINGVRMGDCYTQTTYIADIEELNSDYINEHFGDLQDTAYQRGFEDGKKEAESSEAIEQAKADAFNKGMLFKEEKIHDAYQRGFEDGKAVHDKGCEGCKYAGKVVTGPPCITCSNSYKNQWTAKDDKIEVGDEVEWRNIENNGGKGIVLWIADNSVNGRKLCDIMSASGSAGTWYTDEVLKTGRHFDIASILEEMKT